MPRKSGWIITSVAKVRDFPATPPTCLVRSPKNIWIAGFRCRIAGSASSTYPSTSALIAATVRASIRFSTMTPPSSCRTRTTSSTAAVAGMRLSSAMWTSDLLGWSYDVSVAASKVGRRSPTPVPTLRSGPQQHLPVAWWMLGKNSVIGAVQRLEAGAQPLDRQIGAEHAAVRAERRHDREQPGAHLFGGPRPEDRPAGVDPGRHVRARGPPAR